ncbi:ATP-binding cassette domain-containing protein [Streptococcus sp. sy010]|nr:ATP-binding cassette domain-containing protein [Streptococcus sp. sy010]
MLRKSLMMKATQLSYRNQKKVLFSNLSFDTKKNPLIVIEGKNGSGKSTLLKICLGLVKASSGQVELSERVGYVPDSSEPYFIGMSPQVFFQFLCVNLSLPESDFQQRLEGLRAKFSFHHQLMTTPIQSLSLGEKKKVMLMAAFLLDPPLYLMDEPFSGLDEQSLTYLSEKIKEELTKGKSFVIVTHGYQDYLSDPALTLQL